MPSSVMLYTGPHVLYKSLDARTKKVASLARLLPKIVRKQVALPPLQIVRGLLQGKVANRPQRPSPQRQAQGGLVRRKRGHRGR